MKTHFLLPAFLTLFASLLHAEALPLSEAEQRWLNEHPEIRLGIDPDWAPFEYRDEENTYRGMAADFISLMSQRLGIRMQPETIDNGNEVLLAAKGLQVDLLPAAMKTPQREEYLNFTQPYLDFPMVIISRQDTLFIGELADLTGKRTAVVSGYVSHELLETNHPELTLAPYTTINEALKALSVGEVDAFVGNLASISYAINRLGFTNLKVAAHTPYSFQLGMAVRKDWPEFVLILQKALDSISAHEIRQVREEWVQLRVQQGIDIRKLLPLVLPLGSAVLIVLFGVIVWNRRLRTEISEREAVEQQLRDSEEALLETQRLAHIGWWQWDLGKKSIAWSDEIYSIVGLSPAAFEPTPDAFMAVVHGDDRDALGEEIDKVFKGESDHYLAEFRVVRPNGEVRYVNSFGRLYQSTNSPARHFAGVLHDITEQKSAELALREKQHTLQTLLDNAPIGIWLQNEQGKLLFVNRAFCSSVGISEERFLAVPHYAELYDQEAARRCMLSDAEALASAHPCTSYERVRFVDGHLHDLEIVKARLNDEQGHVTGLIGLSMDITEKKQAEERLRHQAYFDELTGLPNRNYLMEQLEKSLAQARRHSYYNALLFFDLDNFKIINDTLGHHTGDVLLKEIGERLRQIVRTEDTPARLGGDEFVIIVSELGNELDVAVDLSHQIAEKVREALSCPFVIGGHEHHLTASIGISMYPMEPGEDANDILKHADAAMYRAKDTGRNTISFFLPSMQKAAEERLQLQNLLRHAISHDQLQLVYQPQYDQHGVMRGAETLLRWEHPELGGISPTRFIPVAEESGQILDIGIWVLREACARLRQWQMQGVAIETLSINVSPRQFHQAHFVDQVKAVIKESGADPRRLEFELTEGLLIENVDNVSRKMRELKALGFRFAIDDFGTGYSSLAYLKRLPVDRLKIDQSFVRDLLTDASDALIVETIIAMASHLKLEVIAEGVENQEEFAFLQEKGCYQYQGYYFSRPLSLADFDAKLRQNAAKRELH